MAKKNPSVIPTDGAAFQAYMVEEMEKFQDGILTLLEQRSKNNLARMKTLEEEAAADDKADANRDKRIDALQSQVTQLKEEMGNKQDKVTVDEAKIREVWERLKKNSERLAKLAKEETDRAKPFSPTQPKA